MKKLFITLFLFCSIISIAQNYQWGKVEGKELTPWDFVQIKEERQTLPDGISIATRVLDHRLLPLRVKAVSKTYGSTGVITRGVEWENRGEVSLHVERAPALDQLFEPGAYDFSYMTISWSNERRVITRPLQETFTIQSLSGRSSSDYSPWISLFNKETGIYTICQFAWSGNWYLELTGNEREAPRLEIGEYFDNGFLTLLPGQSLQLPEVAVSIGFSPDEAANKLHRYQNRYVVPPQPDGNPMLVQFNSWFPLQQDINGENLIPYIDTAAELGCESFTIDAGWFTKKAWDREAGDWYTNRKAFPEGLRPIADRVHEKGMKFGLWFELESLGDQSEMIQKHPEWCLLWEGKPVMAMGRAHLDYSIPEVFDWALQQFAGMYDECGGIEWVKLDYNISIGSAFEDKQGVRRGDRLRNHILAYYRWLDTLKELYPSLMIENCSSGALRLDLGIAAHTHTSFISDETSPLPSLGMAWSSTLEYIPRALNHWAVGMGNHYPVIDQTLPEGYWNYMFKIPMNGQFGISSRILDWGDDLWNCARRNVEDFKRIRTVISDADCYHLTPQPDFTDPYGWTAIQYVAPGKDKAVLLAYRNRTEQADFTAMLQGLDANRSYTVAIDRMVSGTYTGKQLMDEGLLLTLDNEYRASLIEFTTQ